MNIVDIPSSLSSLEEWSRSYEETYMVYAPTNVLVSQQTISFFLSKIPDCLGCRVREFMRGLIIALMDDRVREAFDLPEASLAARRTAKYFMWAVAFWHRHFSLPRLWPKEYTPVKVPEGVYEEAKRNDTLLRLHPFE